jgi:ribosomal protein S26
MKRERCIQCGESVWIEDDVRPYWKRDRNCSTCAERAGIIRLRSEPPQPRTKENPGGWANSRKETRLEAA